MRTTSLLTLCASLALLQPVQAPAQTACAATCVSTNKTNTFTAYQIIGLNPLGVVSPRQNIGMQVVGPATGPNTENTPFDAFSYNGYSNYVAERYDFKGDQIQAVGAGEQIGGFYGAAFNGHGDPTSAGIGFFTTELQSPTHNGMEIQLKYKPNGATHLQVGLSVSPQGSGGVTVGDDRQFGVIADLGAGTLHAADSIATSNHFRSKGAAPTLSSCGAGPAISGTDVAGRVNTGSGTSTCTINFAKAYALAPICMVQTYAQPAPVTFVTAFSPTHVTVSWKSSFKGGFLYSCQDIG